jgi:hypothetical protein
MKRPASRFVSNHHCLAVTTNKREVISMSSTIITRSLRQPKLEEGVHDAIVESVVAEDGVQTPYGVRDQIVATFDVEGVPVRRRYNKSLFPSSALYAVVSALVGDVPREYDAANLEGKECRVTIVHRTTDAGDVWENIERVMKPNRPSTLE